MCQHIVGTKVRRVLGQSDATTDNLLQNADKKKKKHGRRKCSNEMATKDGGWLARSRHTGEHWKSRTLGQCTLILWFFSVERHVAKWHHLKSGCNGMTLIVTSRDCSYIAKHVTINPRWNSNKRKKQMCPVQYAISENVTVLICQAKANEKE